MFPWNKSSNMPFHMNDMLKNMNPKDVEKYVNDVMTQVFGESLPTSFPHHVSNSNDEKRKEKQQPNMDVFETNDFVYVRIPIDRKNVKRLTVRHTHHTLEIVYDSEKVETKKIMLPSPVRRKGTKTFIRENELEIQLVKMNEIDYTEIEISL